MKSRFLGFGSGLNNIYSCITRQQAVCSCLCPAEELRVRMLHGRIVSHRCPKHTRISIFFPAAERILESLQYTIPMG